MIDHIFVKSLFGASGESWRVLLVSKLFAKCNRRADCLLLQCLFAFNQISTAADSGGQCQYGQCFPHLLSINRPSIHTAHNKSHRHMCAIHWLTLLLRLFCCEQCHHLVVWQCHHQPTSTGRHGQQSCLVQCE